MLSPPGASCGCLGHHPATPSPWIRAVRCTASGYCAQGPGVRQLQLSALAPHVCLEPPWLPSLVHTFPDTCPNKPPHTPSSHQVRLWPALSSPRFWFTALKCSLLSMFKATQRGPSGEPPGWCQHTKGNREHTTLHAGRGSTREEPFKLQVPGWECPHQVACPEPGESLAVIQSFSLP